MIVIVCLDEQGGMMFNRRRQSRDQFVTRDILEMCQGRHLYLNAYSASIFQDLQVEYLIVADNFLEQSGEGDYCFVENQKLLPHEAVIEQLIIYRWNRRYPADFYLDLSLEKGWKKVSTCEFKGFSHDKITKEIYTR